MMRLFRPRPPGLRPSDLYCEWKILYGAWRCERMGWLSLSEARSQLRTRLDAISGYWDDHQGQRILHWQLRVCCAECYGQGSRFRGRRWWRAGGPVICPVCRGMGHIILAEGNNWLSCDRLRLDQAELLRAANIASVRGEEANK